MKSGVRISGGECKGFLVEGTFGDEVRPTTGRLRKSIFDILNWDWRNIVAFDLFAGSGVMGLEMLSRGAEFVFFVEKDGRTVERLKKNIVQLRMSSRVKVIHKDILVALKSTLANQICDIIYLDPPYSSRLASVVMEIIARTPAWSDAVVLVEHFHKENRIKSKYGLFTRFRQKRCGDSVVSFFKKQAQ